MECEGCENVCCMSHRTLEQHNCKTLPVNLPKAAPMAPIISTAKGVQLKRKGAKSLALERKVMLMKMKNKSSGPSSIPPEERLFINVKHGAADCYYHFSTAWAVGRCVDQVARHLKLSNNNDKRGADQLVMCHNDTVLEMSVGLGSVMQSGDTVQLQYLPS